MPNHVVYSDCVITEAFDFVEANQLKDAKLWRRFVNQFREKSDVDDGWRGEYWGKMMRGASLVYAYTKDLELYRLLADTVQDMMASAERNGRISSYPLEEEFKGWDLWSRKYILLGMQYFLEVTEDQIFTEKIVKSMMAQADYILKRIGEEAGKRSITAATNNWRGMNSCSILEPMVRLYSITGVQRYLDFATYIVELGCTDIVNIFELAYQDQLYPYQYPVTKAYEMTSCFEGLLEYYRIVKNEKYRTALINFANKVLESDFTIIGCCGCTHELFDHSSVRQANTNNGDVQQETCVTVTLMKFMYQMTLLTGDSRYVDAFERSFYNAYLGAFNTERKVENCVITDHPTLNFEPLPFSSYSPLTADTRGKLIGGFKIMSDNSYYGCCACIASAGIGLFPKLAILTTEKGVVWNLFAKGTGDAKTPKGNEIHYTITTGYPKNGTVTMVIDCEPEEFEIKIRNPEWSEQTVVRVNTESVETQRGYISIARTWKKGDIIQLVFDMRTRAIYPVPYGSQVLMNEMIWEHDIVIPKFDAEDPKAKCHIALQRGPIVLAQENRLGYNVDEPIQVAVDPEGFVDVKIPKQDTAPYKHIVEVQVPLLDGSWMTVTDYSSAGKDYTEKSKMAAWMLTVK